MLFVEPVSGGVQEVVIWNVSRCEEEDRMSLDVKRKIDMERIWK